MAEPSIWDSIRKPVSSDDEALSAWLSQMGQPATNTPLLAEQAPSTNLNPAEISAPTPEIRPPDVTASLNAPLPVRSPASMNSLAVNRAAQGNDIQDFSNGVIKKLLTNPENLPSVAPLKENIKDQEQLLRGYLDAQLKSSSPDISPFLALVDHWTGGHLTEAYHHLAPKSPEETAAFINQLQSAINKEKTGLTTAQEKLLSNSLGYAKSETANLIKAQNQGAKTALSTDRLVDAIAKRYDDALTPIVNRTGQIGIDRHTLNGALETGAPIAVQMLDEISSGIANALSGAKAAGWNAQETQRIHGSEVTIAKLKQELTNKPENALSPEWRDYLIKTLDRLDDGYNKLAGDVADRLHQGRKYQSPELQQVSDAKWKFYKDYNKNKLSAQPSQVEQQPKIENVRVKEKSSGKIGSIPKSKLDAAISSGGYELVQ